MNTLIKTGIIFIFSILYSAQLMTGDERAESKGSLKKASIDGSGHGWRALTGADFVNVNCNEKTWRWEKGHAIWHIKDGNLTKYAGDYDYYLEKSGGLTDARAAITS